MHLVILANIHAIFVGMSCAGVNCMQIEPKIVELVIVIGIDELVSTTN